MLVGEPQWAGNLDSGKIDEASGLAASWRNPGVFWTHNDGSGGKVYAISAAGNLLGTFDLDVSWSDSEDIATGPGPQPGASYIYLGDIGSNSESREEVRLYRFAEPEVLQEWREDPVKEDLAGVEELTLAYPDGKYNAEALMIDSIRGEVFVVTKQNSRARIYKASLNALSDGATTPMTFALDLSFPVVSAGDISPDGRLVALRNETDAFVWQKAPGEPLEDALRRPSGELRIVGPPEEPNGEAIAFLPESNGYATISEGEGASLYTFSVKVAGGAPGFTDLPQPGAGGWEITFTDCPGSTVALEKSANAIDWREVDRRVVSQTEETIVDAEGGSACFYRLVQSP